MLHYNITRYILYLEKYSPHQPHFTIMQKIARDLIILLTLSLLPINIAAATPKIAVVVTIKPLHSLVAAIMQGIGKPVLLLNTTQSPHHTNLRPSDYRKLANADIVFWDGPELETFMPALKRKYQGKIKFVALMHARGVELLPLRHKHSQTEKTFNPGSHQHPLYDPHFWLSSFNAKQAVKAVTRQLVQLDSRHKSMYLKNQQRTLKHIDNLNRLVAKKLNNIKTPFISYHDAYQYFEKEYHLNRLASVNLNEESSPGIRHIQYIKSLINQQHVKCIFYEAPVKPPIIKTLLKNTTARAVELDVLGLNQKAGQSLWFKTIKTLASKMAQCLKKPQK